MKYFVDGDQLVITKDDFVDFQESPALFYPLESEIAKTVLEAGSLIALPIGDLMQIRDLLAMGGISAAAPGAAMSGNTAEGLRFNWNVPHEVDLPDPPRKQH